MGGCLFQRSGRCGVWMVVDLCLFSQFLCLCHPYIPQIFMVFFYSLVITNVLKRRRSWPQRKVILYLWEGDNVAVILWSREVVAKSGVICVTIFYPHYYGITTNQVLYKKQRLTFDTIAVFKFVLVSLTIPVSLPRQNLVDKCFHDECYQNFKNHQDDNVETQKIQSHKPAQLCLGCKPFLKAFYKLPSIKKMYNVHIIYEKPTIIKTHANTLKDWASM